MAGRRDAVDVDADRPLAELVAELELRGSLRQLIGLEPAASSERVRGVAYDSRTIQPGDVFVAVAGARNDGLEYAAEAVRRGAVAIVAERAVDLNVPQVLVDAPRAALAVASAWLYGNPSRELGVVGVTGTDGKTTTCFLIRSMLMACGLPAGMITTVTTVIGDQAIGYSRETTPESPVVQGYLRGMVEAGDHIAVLESTSHGLALDRLAEVAYDVAVLTNVTHEHLDLHGTIEEYVAAKRSLFDRLAVGHRNPDKGWPKSAVVNIRDQHAATFLSASHRAGARPLTYSADPRLVADVCATAVRDDRTGLSVGVRTARWEGEIRVDLAGAYNADNVLAAVGVGEALSLDPDRMKSGLASVRAVPGRMERIEAGQEFEVYIDFAHTAAALALVLDGLAPVASSRGAGLIAVFGSSGERDVLKRPMMGRVAGERCRVAVLTNEEPRGEDEMSIIEQIAAGAEQAGMRRHRDLFLITDRAAAIGKAFAVAQPGDIVVLAGKGHEQAMEMAYGTIPWNEAEIARQTLKAMGYGG